MANTHQKNVPFQILVVETIDVIVIGDRGGTLKKQQHYIVHIVLFSFLVSYSLYVCVFIVIFFCLFLFLFSLLYSFTQA